MPTIILIHLTSLANELHPFANIAELEGHPLLWVTKDHGKPLVFRIYIYNGSGNPSPASFNAIAKSTFKGVKAYLLTNFNLFLLCHQDTPPSSAVMKYRLNLTSSPSAFTLLSVIA
jgi:hypothetical protein